MRKPISDRNSRNLIRSSEEIQTAAVQIAWKAQKTCNYLRFEWQQIWDFETKWLQSIGNRESDLLDLRERIPRFELRRIQKSAIPRRESERGWKRNASCWCVTRDFRNPSASGIDRSDREFWEENSRRRQAKCKRGRARRINVIRGSLYRAFATVLETDWLFYACT